MQVYRVRFDNGDWIVKAESFGDAVEKWRAWILAEWKRGGHYNGPEDDDVEPEEVHLMEDWTVIP